MVMCQETGNLTVDIFQNRTGRFGGIIQFYDYGGKIYSRIQKFRISKLQAQIHNFLIRGSGRNGKLQCQPGRSFKGMKGFAAVRAEFLFIKGLCLQDRFPYFLRI